MFSQCPKCHTVCYIGIPELRIARGMVICKHCRAEFNALESLSDVPAVIPAPLFGSSNKSPLQHWLGKFLNIQSNAFWGLCFGLCVIGLCLQIYHLQFFAWSQNPQIRPWLIQSCQWFNCSIPPYRNLQEISVLQGELALNENNSYEFTSTLTNQAEFPQPLPAIKLSFVNLAGDVIAYRIFSAADYSSSAPNHSIGSNETIQISLHIAPTATILGGYYFELV